MLSSVTKKFIHNMNRIGFTPKYSFSNYVQLPDDKKFEFPLKLQGIHTDIDFNKSKKIQIALEKIYPGISDGVKLAYVGFLDAVAENDTEYFEEVCEEKLANSLIDSLDSLKERGYTIQIEDGLSEDSVTAEFDQYSLVAGVQQNRKQNKSKSNYMEQNFNLGTFEGKFFIDSTDPSSLVNGNIFTQFKCVFKMNQRVLILDQNKKVVAGENTSGVHSVLFESASESNKKANLMNLVQSVMGSGGGFGSIFKAANNKDKIEQKMTEMLSPDDLVWKISDVDFHLKGNPFAV